MQVISTVFGKVVWTKQDIVLHQQIEQSDI